MQFAVVLKALCRMVFCCSISLFVCKLTLGAPTDYPHTYKALLEDCRTKTVKLMNRPLPPKSAPKEQKRAAVVQQIEDVANAYSEYGHKLEALKPPVKFQEVHKTTLLWLCGEAQDNLKWAKALLNGNREERNRVFHENQTHELKTMLRVQQALKRAGGSNKELDAVIGELQQSSKTPSSNSPKQ